MKVLQMNHAFIYYYAKGTNFVLSTIHFHAVILLRDLILSVYIYKSMYTYT